MICDRDYVHDYIMEFPYYFTILEYKEYFLLPVLYNTVQYSSRCRSVAVQYDTLLVSCLS